MRVLGPEGNVESQTHSFKVTPEHLANAVLPVNLDSIGQPNQNLLFAETIRTRLTQRRGFRINFPKTDRSVGSYAFIGFPIRRLL